MYEVLLLCKILTLLSVSNVIKLLLSQNPFYVCAPSSADEWFALILSVVSSQQTARLQLARQQAQDHPEDEDWQEKIQEIKHE